MKNTAFELLTAVLVLLFFYTGFSKYADFGFFARAIQKQHFPGWLTCIVIYGLPPIEMITGLLLIPERTRRNGLWLSASLLGVFTLYITAILMHIFARTPCPCGGIISTLRWPQHLVINLLFLAVNWGAIRLSGRKTKTNKTNLGQ